MSSSARIGGGKGGVARPAIALRELWQVAFDPASYLAVLLTAASSFPSQLRLHLMANKRFRKFLRLLWRIVDLWKAYLEVSVNSRSHTAGTKFKCIRTRRCNKIFRLAWTCRQISEKFSRTKIKQPGQNMHQLRVSMPGLEIVSRWECVPKKCAKVSVWK